MNGLCVGRAPGSPLLPLSTFPGVVMQNVDSERMVQAIMTKGECRRLLGMKKEGAQCRGIGSARTQDEDCGAAREFRSGSVSRGFPSWLESWQYWGLRNCLLFAALCIELACFAVLEDQGVVEAGASTVRPSERIRFFARVLYYIASSSFVQ